MSKLSIRIKEESEDDKIVHVNESEIKDFTKFKEKIMEQTGKVIDDEIDIKFVLNDNLLENTEDLKNHVISIVT